MYLQLSQALKQVAHSEWDDNAKVAVEQFIDQNVAVESAQISSHVLVYLFAGVLDLQMQDGLTTRVLPHQCVFIAANVQFQLKASAAASFLSLQFLPSCLVDLSGLQHQGLSYSSRLIAGDSYISEVFAMIDKEMSNRDLHSDLALSSLTSYVGIYLVRNFSQVLPFAPSEVARPELCRINHALEIIESNLSSEMQISEIVAATGLSTYAFLRAFKEVTGKSPHQYIIGRRLEAAKRMLRNPSISFEEIARRTGFGNQSHFTRTFRKHFGTTPSESRRP